MVPFCMISSATQDSVSRLVTESLMCFATASDKAFENTDCMIAILHWQAKNRFYESTQRLIQPRPVLCLKATLTTGSYEVARKHSPQPQKRTAVFNKPILPNIVFIFSV